MTAAWWSSDDPALGIVRRPTERPGSTSRDSDDRTTVTTIRDAAERRDVPTIVGDPRTVLEDDPAVVVTVDELALRALVRASPAIPVLPVDAEDGLYSVPSDRIDDAIGSLLADRTRRSDLRLLSVAVDGEPLGTGLRDLSLITAEPARISEFAVERPDDAVAVDPAVDDGAAVGESVLPERLGAITQVRADGIVIATAAGSQGYAAAADGPLVAPGSGLAIVPVAPFVTDSHSWVVPPTRLSLSVRRDAVPITVRLDGRSETTVDHTDEVVVDATETLPVIVTPESDPLFDDPP